MQPQAVGKLVKIVVRVKGVDAKALRLEIILEQPRRSPRFMCRMHPRA